MKGQQQRFRLDMGKFPTVCARRCQLAVLCSPGMWGTFSIWRWFGKKRSWPGLCGLASLQPGSRDRQGAQVRSPHCWLCHCCFKSTQGSPLPLPSCKAEVLPRRPDCLGTHVCSPYSSTRGCSPVLSLGYSWSSGAKRPLPTLLPSCLCT